MKIQYRKEGDYFVPDWEIPEIQRLCEIFSVNTGLLR